MDEQNLFSQVLDALTGLTNFKTYLTGLDEMIYASNQLNKSFLQGRGRIEQMQYAVADAIPRVQKLGGDVEDVITTMGEVAEATRRNLIANEETVSELTAANKLLGTSVSVLSDAFLDVGYMIDDVGEKLEESIFYVQSIGGNAREVIIDVVNNMDQLNRYQFEGGVKGLTKMAAQASMLRFDMGETFKFAEKVLTPEGAIEMASAFQRLGVAAGTLVDPFQLMNQSINDPSGLQTSLARVAENFVSFSKEAGRFTISREGVLRLREMETEAGLTQGTLSKMGIAAAEMGERMKQVSMAGLKFEREEDKQFLANITSMGEGGVFQITLDDNSKVDLNKINQEQFDRLIQRERERPSTLEGMQRAQMNMSETIMADVRAIRDKIVYGAITLGPIPKLTEELRSVTTSATSAFEKSFDTSDIRNALTGVYKDLEKVFTGEGDLFTRLETWEQTTENKLSKLDDNFLKYFDKVTENFKESLRGSSANEMQLKDVMTSFQNQVIKPIESKLSDKYAGQSFLEGQQPLSSQMSKMTTAPGTTLGTTQLTGNINMTVNHTFPPEFSRLSQAEQLKIFNQYLEDQMRSQSFKQYFIDLFQNQANPLSTTQRQ